MCLCVDCCWRQGLCLAAGARADQQLSWPTLGSEWLCASPEALWPTELLVKAKLPPPRSVDNTSLSIRQGGKSVSSADSGAQTGKCQEPCWTPGKQLHSLSHALLLGCRLLHTSGWETQNENSFSLSHGSFLLLGFHCQHCCEARFLKIHSLEP